MTLPAIIDEQDTAITAAVLVFKRELESVVSAAKAKLQARLQTALVLDAAGTIKSTRANQAVLKKLDQWFIEEMAASGFVHLSREFVNRFPGQLPFFDQIVETIAAQTKTPIKFSWTAADKRAFADFGATTRLSLGGVVANVANAVKQNVLFSFASLKYSDLVVLLAHRLDTVVPKAVSIADTAMAVFFRTVSAAGYKKLAFYFDGIRYRYYGPLDQLNRPVCKRLMRESKSGQTWTQEEIEAMDPGPSGLGSMFIFAAGWNCRHQWILVPGTATVPA